MNNKQYKIYEKEFYQALKLATKARKLKLSSEQDIYVKKDEYFYHAFYFIEGFANNQLNIILDISIKYHRFDELQYGILHPQNDLHFTDKLRANSGVLCDTAFPRIRKAFDVDESLESIPKAVEELLDFLKDYYNNFLTMVKKDYADLDGYYIAHEKENPRLAGLACLDKKDYQGAIRCFSALEPGDQNDEWIVLIETEEQLKRAQENGYIPNKSSTRSLIYAFVKKTGLSQYKDEELSFFRSRRDQFIDYAIALKNGLEWTNDRAMYGLLKEERK